LTDFRLDVVLRTHNRAHLIEAAVESVFAANADGINLRVVIVDNASSDSTSMVLAQLAAAHGERIAVLHEPKPGGQHALNAAIALCTAPVIAFFDDDERVDAGWLQVIKRELSDCETDFIAGQCRPIWQEGAEAPDWLPAAYGGVLGIIDSAQTRTQFTASFSGMLTQGNCAVRRSIFALAGPYPEHLSTAEDRWLHDWLMQNGKIGFYCPDLIINHIMQADRLSKTYFRAWAAREGRDRAACDRLAVAPNPLGQLWYWRRFAEDLAVVGAAALTGNLGGAKAFAAELNLRQSWAYAKQSFMPLGAV
jgi:glycosyltransferase involved in cell wall biosynthesis